jgi:hypothetical protein
LGNQASFNQVEIRTLEGFPSSHDDDGLFATHCSFGILGMARLFKVAVNVDSLVHDNKVTYKNAGAEQPQLIHYHAAAGVAHIVSSSLNAEPIKKSVGLKGRCELGS